MKGENGGNGKGRNVCRLKGGWLLQALSPGKAPQHPTKLGVLQGLAGKKDATKGGSTPVWWHKVYVMVAYAVKESL